MNRRSSLSKSRRPSSTLRVFSSPWTKCRILLRARDVAAKFSQSRLGVWPACVTISTMSPLLSARAQRHHAAVDARADALVADVGVNRVREVHRRRSARQRLHLALRREDVDLLRVELDPEVLHELLRVAHLLLQLEQPAQPVESTARRVPAPTRPSLYFQCAAMPSSAIRCISSVRICTSNGRPRSPTTDVCSDWYPFGRGIAMKSLNRPGTGDHIWWMMPSTRVAVLDGRRDDPQRDEVVDLIERDPLALQLLVDRPEALDAAVDRDHGNLRFVELRLELACGARRSSPPSRAACASTSCRSAWYAAGSM